MITTSPYSLSDSYILTVYPKPFFYSIILTVYPKPYNSLFTQLHHPVQHHVLSLKQYYSLEQVILEDIDASSKKRHQSAAVATQQRPIVQLSFKPPLWKRLLGKRNVVMRRELAADVSDLFQERVRTPAAQKPSLSETSNQILDRVKSFKESVLTKFNKNAKK